MTSLKRKLLSILTTVQPPGMPLSKLPSLFLESDPSAAFALVDLEIAGLITVECGDEGHFFSITPAGRAALLPERSV